MNYIKIGKTIIFISPDDKLIFSVDCVVYFTGTSVVVYLRKLKKHYDENYVSIENLSKPN